MAGARDAGRRRDWAAGYGYEVTEPFYVDPHFTLYCADAIEVMRELPAESVDAVVTDPPYGLEFMGKEWDSLSPGPAKLRKSGDTAREGVRGEWSLARPQDYTRGTRQMQAWHEAWAREAFRLLKPGGHLLSFGGTRTYHRLTCAIEDAGFEIRDCLVWAYASGFPKSLDVGKAIDKRGGADIAWFGPWLRQERERRGITQKSLAIHFPSKTGGLTGCVANWELGLNLPTVDQFNKLCEVLGLPFTRIEEAERAVIEETNLTYGYQRNGERWDKGYDVTAPATDDAKRWDGWGTALKPAWEPIVLARKPLRGTVAANVLAYGTGALNIDGTRIGYDGLRDEEAAKPASPGNPEGLYGFGGAWSGSNPPGRWPANVVLTDPIFDGGIDGVVGGGPTDGGDFRGPTARIRNNGLGLGTPEIRGGSSQAPDQYGDTGTYSRFFALPARMDTCYYCGAPNADASSAEILTPATQSDTAPEPASSPRNSYPNGPVPSVGIPSDEAGGSTAHQPVAALDDVASVSRPGPLTTSDTATGLWSEHELTTPPTRRSRRQETSQRSESRSDHVTSAAQNGTSSDTTTTTRDRWMCESCAALVTAESTQDETLGGVRAFPEVPADSPDHVKFLLIPKEARSGREPLVRGTLTEQDRRTMGGGLTGVSGDRSGRGGEAKPLEMGNAKRENLHPTVKPLELMRHLVRLVTPPGGLVLDPFLGSGTTAIAANAEGFRAIGIEKEREYCEIVVARLPGQGLGLGLGGAAL
jgi:DNA modification methylase/transcriptional regulator with XRE-family HTH domain